MAKFDADYFLIRFTPRRARSKWSEVDRVRASELIEEGRMTPSGLAEVERAKADGRWDAAYAPPSRATVPEDLAEALGTERGRENLVRPSRQPEPLCHPASCSGCQEAGDASSLDREDGGMLAGGEVPYPKGS